MTPEEARVIAEVIEQLSDPKEVERMLTGKGDDVRIRQASAEAKGIATTFAEAAQTGSERVDLEPAAGEVTVFVEAARRRGVDVYQVDPLGGKYGIVLGIADPGNIAVAPDAVRDIAGVKGRPAPVPPRP